MDFLIPTRTDRPGNDPIFALNIEAGKRAAAGERVVNATVGVLLDEDGELAVMNAVAEALRDVPERVAAGYAPITGDPEFLAAVVDDLFGKSQAAGWTAAVATPGGTGALRLAIANFVEPQQTVLTTSYYWGPYKTLADEVDRHLATFRMFDERGRLDVVDFERKLHAAVEAQGRALVILNSPCHNPTGYSFDDDEWRAIVGAVKRACELGEPGNPGTSRRAPVTIVLDVAYAHYGATGIDSYVDRLLELAGSAMLLIAWSASKSFAQYGQRVGALLAVHPDPDQRRRVQNALNYSCRGTWSTCNAGGMAAVTRALRDPALRARVERERADLKAQLDRRVARWNQLAAERKLQFPRYTGGFFLTVFCDDAHAVAGRLKNEGIFVVPIAGGLRVALCSVAERDIPRVVDAIARQLGQ